MGKRQVHVIPVPKPVSFALVVLTTAAMAGLLYALSGKAYAANDHPIRELLVRLLGGQRDVVSRDALLAFLMPVLANIFLFVPWGFLSFVALDSPKRARGRTYAITLVAATVLAAGLHLWQEFLPTRVTSPWDTFANALGALAGAAAGHARKGVRVVFEF